MRKRRESARLDSLCRKISYCFTDLSLLKKALTHRSYLTNSADTLQSNERLEFLGDAVLGLVVTEALYERFPDRSEGDLTKAKSYIVSREILGREAEDLGLGAYLVLGSGEESSGGRKRKSILSDAYEALVGAIYLDGGLESVEEFLKSYLLDDMDSLLDRRVYKNYKSWILEFAQEDGGKGPEYIVIDESGPDHQKLYTIEVRVHGQALGVGSGTTKKKAEQAAAHQAIVRLGLMPDE